jgi:hypothetical protein
MNEAKNPRTRMPAARGRAMMVAIGRQTFYPFGAALLSHT